MNIFVLSDLHMCNGGRLDTFKWDAKDFIDKLEYVRETYSIDKVILNGDIYDLYKYSLKEITDKNAQIINYFESIHAVYIKGNHDIKHPKGLRYYLIVNRKGQRIRIEHGHKANFFNGTRAGRCICHSLFKMLKVCVHMPFAVRLYFGRLLKNEGLSRDRRYSFYTYLRYAVHLLQRNDVVILGHTHKLEVHTTYTGDKAKLYLNSGSCSFGRFEGMILDTETLRYHLINKSTSFSHKPMFTSGFVPLTMQHKAVSDYVAA
jgi:predicted phosphodiesterase